MWCDVGLGGGGVGNIGSGYKGEGQGPGSSPGSPGLGISNENEASGRVGAPGGSWRGFVVSARCRLVARAK